MQPFNLFLLTLLLALSYANCYAQPPAPGYAPLAFQSAHPGSYALPVISKAADGEVLNTANQTRTLYSYMGDKLVLLSFIYTTCSDVNGCPLATQVLHKISRQLQTQPELANKLRILTLSFNPQHDSPAVMQQYGKDLQKSPLDWQFLTTASAQQLQPILANYPQNVEKVLNSQGEFTGSYNHLLRVYLIDTHQQIRNIYNLDFLHADTVINDVKTLLTQAVQHKTIAQTNPTNVYRAGDNKQNYQQADYQTHSLALTARTGKAANLLELVNKTQLGLPTLPQPSDNQCSAARIAIGRKLFYDRRLSFNNTVSCAMCHIPEQGFSSNELSTPVGVEGRSVRRNTPTLYNVGYAQLLFHDGRENRLEQQAWGPLLAHNEMANPAIAFVLDKINGFADYQGMFGKGFHKLASMETVGQALACYQRSLNSADSAFDRWFYGKQSNALPTPAQRGYALFIGKAACSQCHTISEKYALFTDQQRHNTGVGVLAAMAKPSTKQQVQLAPGVFVDVDKQQLASVAEPKPNDLGYYEISQNPADRWAYKTPSLRNVALTAPYMHNGSLASLTEVVEFYNQGGVANENLAPEMKPLHLTATEITDLVAFLQALTGNNIDALVADGFAAPVGESH